MFKKIRSEKSKQRSIIITRPCVHIAFQNKDQDQAQVENSYIMDYF